MDNKQENRLKQITETRVNTMLLKCSCVTHPAVHLAFPPALVTPDLAVDLDNVTFPQGQLPHVTGGEVVPGDRCADHSRREHCGPKWDRMILAPCSLHEGPQVTIYWLVGSFNQIMNRHV